MKILIYSVNYAAGSTGIPKTNGEMGAWLALRGHAVDVIAAPPHYPQWRVEDSYRGRMFTTEHADRVHIRRAPIYLPERSAVQTLDRVLLECSFSLSSLRYWLPILLRRGRYDVVIVVTPSIQSGIYPWLYRNVRSVPWVLHVQDLQVDAALGLGMLGGSVKAKTLRAFEDFVLSRATVVSTITEAMRRRITARGIPESRTWLFPNWVDTRVIRPTAKDNAFRRSLGISPDQVLVMCAGAMGEKHGLEVVLDAAHRLRSEAKVSFVLIGDGSARSRLEAMAGQLSLTNLQFLPVQPADRLGEMLAAADLHLVVQRRSAADLVMPSRLTGILAAGRPAIGTADPGTTMHDLLGTGIGRVVPPEDAASLAGVILELAASPEQCAEMGRRARGYAEAHLDNETILGEFDSKLNELVERERAASESDRAA